MEDDSVAKVGTLQELNEALEDSSKKTIELTQDITVEYNSVLTPEERQTKLNDMIKLGLESIIEN